MVIETPIWNQVCLTPPPVCTVKCQWRKETKILNCTLKKISSSMNFFHNVEAESKLLSAVIKTLKGELRMDKSFQLAGKIIQCIKKCGMMNLTEDLTKLEKTSNEGVNFDQQPSRQMLEYTLVRIQGFINLLKFLVDLCGKAAIHLKGKMQIGHTPSLVLMLFSIVSRLWSLSKFFVENAFEWYLLLLPSLKHLEATPVDWLPPGYEFPPLPVELEQVPWIDQNKVFTSLRSFLSDFDDSVTPTSNLPFMNTMEDLGESISRKDFAVAGQAKSKNPAEKGKTPQDTIVFRVKSTQTTVSRPVIVFEPRKRKLDESEPENNNFGVKEQVTQPVKHFLKSKLSRPLIEQKPQILHDQLTTGNVSKTVIKEPVLSRRTEDIAEQLVTLKQGLGKLRPSEADTVVPKFKGKVVTVQEKNSSASNEPLLISVSKNNLCVQRDKILTVSKRANGGKACDKSNIVKNVPFKSQIGRVVPTASDASTSSKKDRVAKLLAKKKKVAGIKKQKSKSWVIS